MTEEELEQHLIERYQADLEAGVFATNALLNLILLRVIRLERLVREMPGCTPWGTSKP